MPARKEAMELLNKLMRAMLLWVIAVAAKAASQTIKPDCEATCGDVSIPYPFGTREGCYLNNNFLIACNHSVEPPTPFLWHNHSNIQVLNVSLEDHRLRVYTFVGTDCYDDMGRRTDQRTLAYAILPVFPFSTTGNKFTAIGCDTYAVIKGSNGAEDIATGCLSVCDNLGSVTNGSCSGIGCCQTSIPKGLLNYNASVTSFRNHTEVWKFNPCSYAFLAEEESFNFSSADLIDLQKRTVFPTLLDWSVGNITCQEAEKDLTSYACKKNSVCSNSDNGLGYRCYCSLGYEGNPYLPNGCHDIDECRDPRRNNCTKICTNTPGSYTCSCPKGYHGNGRKDETGDGCIPDDDRLLIVKITVGICVGLVALLVTSSWLYWGFKKRRFIKLKEKFFMQNGGLMLQQELHGREGSDKAVKIFTAEELEKGTNKYDEDTIIGRGGYGTVYKGILADGKVVAIKKSKVVDQNQIEQFINEVVVLSQINHRNVVKLLGCCLETEVPLLVYEFITNGTLFDHIHNKSKGPSILWAARLRIATETAGVLSYLHSSASVPIIHRDVKSTNILLDDNLTAKVSDFGASRLVPLDQTQLSTMVQGTLGYLDPEYLHTSQLTEKSDVYSFGVVLVELLTGKKALSFDRREEERCLAMHFLSSLKEDRLFQVLDQDCVVPRDNENLEQLKEVAMLAKRCLQVKGEERPTMKEVARELDGIRMMTKHPWVNIELNNTEETESLLASELSNPTYNINNGGNYLNTMNTFETTTNQIMSSLSNGR